MITGRTEIKHSCRKSKGKQGVNLHTWILVSWFIPATTRKNSIWETKIQNRPKTVNLLQIRMASLLLVCRTWRNKEDVDCTVERIEYIHYYVAVTVCLLAGRNAKVWNKITISFPPKASCYELRYKYIVINSLYWESGIERLACLP